MSGICVITLDHNASTVAERTAVDRRFWADVPLLREADAIHEYLTLCTCNRSELYLVLPEDGRQAETAASLAPPGSRIFNGQDAARHLLRVLLGLESMARGESHIAAQVKEAYASETGCGKVLHRLFQRAFGIASALRSCYHPGREPSVQFLAADLFRKRGGGSALVVGQGAFGLEMAALLKTMGFGVSVTNRTPRENEPGDKAGAPRRIGWASWKDGLAEYDAIFLCTGAPAPVLSTADAVRIRKDAALFDLGSPLQSECRTANCVTLDDMRGLARVTLAEYGRSLSRLEEEASRASGALFAEISLLADDTWKRLALARAQSLARERAAAQAKKLGVPPEALEAFGASLLKNYLHPLAATPAAHSARAWRILSGEGK